MRKFLYVAIVLGLVIVVYLGYLKWGGKKSFAASEIIQPVVKENSRWKYFVERTTMVRNNLAKKDKERVFVDRALVYFGTGAEQAGGQLKEIPHIVYVDEDQKRRPGYIATPGIQTFGVEKFTMARKIPRGLATEIPGDIGSEPNLALPVQLFWSAFNGFPLKPEAQLERGLRWRSTLYLFYGESADFPFPATISHEVIGSERKKQRRCVVIKYTIAGRLKMADHPEWFTQEELRENRGEMGLKGGGTAYFDPAEGIIVEKEQMISWTLFEEKLSRLKDGKIGWVLTADEEETVTIKVSLQPEEGEAVGLPAGTGHPLLSYVLIAAVIGIAIVGLILLLKKRTSKSRI